MIIPVFVVPHGGRHQRKARLKRLLARRSNHRIIEALSIEAGGKTLFAAVEQHDLDGIVAKRKSDPYRGGFSNGTKKDSGPIKIFRCELAVLLGAIIENGLASLLLIADSYTKTHNNNRQEPDHQS